MYFIRSTLFRILLPTLSVMANHLNSLHRAKTKPADEDGLVTRNVTYGQTLRPLANTARQ